MITVNFQGVPTDFVRDAIISNPNYDSLRHIPVTVVPTPIPDTFFNVRVPLSHRSSDLVMHLKNGLSIDFFLTSNATMSPYSHYSSTWLHMRHHFYDAELIYKHCLSNDLIGTLTIRKESFVFLVVFDYASVYDRKNPGGAVRAFKNAFNDSYLNSATYLRSSGVGHHLSQVDETPQNEILIIKSHDPANFQGPRKRLIGIFIIIIVIAPCCAGILIVILG
jgi:hypothetical protein